jgi:hypothetical protein
MKDDEVFDLVRYRLEQAQVALDAVRFVEAVKKYLLAGQK